MAPHNKNGALSDYEQQRINNLEENRRILESIRQEQLYNFGGLQNNKPAKRSRPKDEERNIGTGKKKLSKPPTTVNTPDENSDVENDMNVRRKSARLCGKKPRISWKNADDGQDDSADEDFDSDKEEYGISDDDEEFKGAKQRKSLAPKGPKQKIIIPKNRPNFYGAVPGVEVGRIWETRMACCADGIHRPTVAGIHAGPEGAYSISLAGGYEDDVDLGDCFTYTGEGGRALNGTASNPKNLRTAPQSKDQTLTRGNLALSLNISSRNAVRVIRGSKLNNEFAPDYGYRYDGLYTVEKYWSCVGKSGFKVYKFALRRCPDQAPPPWVSGVVSHANTSLPTNPKDDNLDEDEETDERQPKLLQVKLFNK